MTETLPPKDPQAVLPYELNWADWLLTENAIMTSAQWSIPDGSTLVIEDNYLLDGVSEEVDPGTLVENSQAVVWLSGGTAKTKYRLTCHILTAPDGKTDERSITIKVKER